MAEIFLFSSLSIILYSYVIYPAIIWLAAWIRGQSPQIHSCPDASLPAVSLLIAVHNEEAVVGDRILNALQTDYPHSSIEILVGSDGSTDKTTSIVSGFGDSRIRLLDFQKQGGKASVLNRLVPEAKGEVLVFSDANTFFKPLAIRNLVETLLSPGVTVACGRLVLTDPESGGNVDSLYWRYETAIKRAEGQLGAVLGANGAIYALRKDHFIRLPDKTIVDDFVGPLLAKIHNGGKIIYQPDAIASEESPASIRSEFGRRVRIGTGNFQSLGSVWPLFHPKFGWTSLALISHKLLRWCVPFCMIIAFISNVFLVCTPPYGILLLCQLVFYTAATAGAIVTGGGTFGKLLRLTTMFTGMNAALALGFVRWATGVRSGAWGRTTRPEA